MKKHLITATFAVAIAAMAGYNTYLSTVEDSMSDMVLENVEALANDTEIIKEFYVVARYDICSMLKVTDVSGEIASEVSIGQLLTKGTLAELEGNFRGKITVESVDCHWRKCLSTINPQEIDCSESRDWSECHSQCDHSDNQM